MLQKSILLSKALTLSWLYKRTTKSTAAIAVPNYSSYFKFVLCLWSVIRLFPAVRLLVENERHEIYAGY